MGLLMRWLLIVTVCAWQAVRGLAEAITMHYPNPRDHPVFDWYHQIRLAEYAMFCAACWCVFDWYLTGSRAFKDYLIAAGLSVAAWELFELSYLWGRVGQASAHENLLGLWPLDGSGVLYLHVARAIIGIALIWKGNAR